MQRRHALRNNQWARIKDTFPGKETGITKDGDLAIPLFRGLSCEHMYSIRLVSEAPNVESKRCRHRFP